MTASESLIQEIIARLRHNALEQRITDSETAWEHALGLYSPENGDITPKLTGTEAAEDWERYQRLITSAGARVLKTKRQAAIGKLTWGDDDTTIEERKKLDEELGFLNLPNMAEKLMDWWTVERIIATHAYQDEQGVNRLNRLSGYLQPYVSKHNMDEATGLYQATRYHNGRAYVWRVRVYDWEHEDPDEGTCIIREWIDLGSPFALAGEHTVYDGSQTKEDGSIIGKPLKPSLIYGNTDHQGLVISPFMTAQPTMLSIMATQIRLERAEDFLAYPVPVAKGSVDVKTVTPGMLVEVDKDGDFSFAEPGNLEQLHTRLDRKVTQLEKDMALPATISNSSNRSGDSIAEQNTDFYNEAQADAETIGQLLTDSVQQFGRLEGTKRDVPVTITPNLRYIMKVVFERLEQGVSKGFIPKYVAMREAQRFFETWSDEELQEDMKRAKDGRSLDDILGNLDGSTPT